MLMRAKMVIRSIEQYEGGTEKLNMSAIGKPSGYDDDGKDEDNTYANFTPMADLSMSINNPDLHGKFKPGQEFYVDFTPVDESDGE